MRRVTATAMVIMTASGALVVALGLPSAHGGSTPLASSAEEMPDPITGPLDRLDAERSNVEPPAARTVELPAAKTAEPPAAKVEPPAARTVQPPAAKFEPPAARVEPPAARTVQPPAAPNRTAKDRNTAVPASPQPPLAPRVVAPSVDGRLRSAALTAVAFARAQLGKPYVWGGNGTPGFDCSGLTTASYAAAKTAIPRTAQTQYNHGPRLPAGAPLQPGDLLFFGTPRDIHHVGISLGGTLMIHAPTFGQTVRVQDYRTLLDYAGASRPAT